jgi:NitT/TauT family transport system substrate-binding protein
LNIPYIAATIGAIFAMMLAPCSASRPAGPILRVGHFPNITHVQALVAHNLSRQGRGWFEERLGSDVRVEWFVYNAGPSAMEAIFARSIDLSYVGPSPAINAYARAQGADVRIIAGAVEGGSALVVQPELGLRAAADFRGKKIGTPQLGNTQDVAARAWLSAGGLRITLTGGDAQVIPTANPDQLGLFQRKQLDAVWTIEPWVSRLEIEAGGKVLLEETDAVTTVLVSSVAFLAGKSDLARRFVLAHEALTEWIRSNPSEAQAMVRDELVREMCAAITPELISHAWSRIVVTSAVPMNALERFVAKAKDAGFLRSGVDLSRLVERP